VVDATGAEVGPLELIHGPIAVALRQVEGTLVGLPVAQYFAERPFTGSGFYHASADCSGDRYMFDEGQFVPIAYVTAGFAIYPIGSPHRLVTRSLERIPPGQNPNQPGICEVTGAFEYTVRSPRIVDLSTLGFASPFAVR
jgi:hypothetical protein